MNEEQIPLGMLDFEKNANLLQSELAEVVFDKLPSKRWIQQNVVYTDGVVDIEATSLRMNISVRYNTDFTSYHGATYGINGDKNPISIELSSLGHRIGDVHLTFGHELGHIFLDRDLNISATPNTLIGSNTAVERFCDYFGLRLAVPDEEVEFIDEVDAATIAMLSERFRVSHGSMMERFMRLDKLPSRIAYDVTIPPSENAIFKNKVSRHVICLDCIDGVKHEIKEDIMTLPAFDFTSDRFYESTMDTPSHGYTLLHPTNHEKLNRRYGR